uniref:Secreted protein n=1 Tax=Aedes albopictus TaxID=7160 RepID=A0A1W7R514_AEDAL
MVRPASRIFIKFLELLACVACIITKIITDHESRRVFVRNQKLSREWSLIHNVTWSSGGNAFTNIVYGGYTIVIALMLITRCVDAKSRPTLFEKIVLTLGTLLFFAAGGLVFASIDQVHPDLHDNAIILGCLSFLVAILFVIDLADPLARMTAHMTQTESSSMTNISRASETEKGVTLKKDVSTDTESPVYLISGQDRYKDMNEPDRRRFVDSNGRDYPERDEPDRRSYRKSESRRQSYLESIGEGLDYSRESIVERKVLPSVQTPVFAHVRPAPEESRRIAGKEIQYLPRYDYRDRRDYRDAGPHSGRQPLHQQSPKTPSYHDNESFVEEISPSRRSTYVPADKFDNEAVQMNPRPRPPPPAKPTTSPIRTTATTGHESHGSGSGSSGCSGCNCSQRSLPGRRREQARDEPDIPIKPGYVANAAKKWDDRLRSKSQPIIGLNTMV